MAPDWKFDDGKSRDQLGGRYGLTAISRCNDTTNLNVSLPQNGVFGNFDPFGRSPGAIAETCLRGSHRQ